MHSTERALTISMMEQRKLNQNLLRKKKRRLSVLGAVVFGKQKATSVHTAVMSESEFLV
jgi:hypothetical protein